MRFLNIFLLVSLVATGLAESFGWSCISSKTGGLFYALLTASVIVESGKELFLKLKSS